MKRTVIFALLISAFSIIFPFISVFPEKSSAQSGDSSVDAGVTITVKNGDTVSEMRLSDYLVGVVSAEMPASFEVEALKAQAVAARTYTIYKKAVNPSSNHPDADVCTDSACCKAYIDENTRRNRWGKSFEEYSIKIADAVSSTDGECLIYDGEPILAVFHSSSSGITESSGNVWNTQLPYLVSVLSPEGDEVPKYTETVTISLSDFRETVLSKYPEAVFSDNEQSYITDIAMDSGGRLGSCKVGNISLTGKELRSLFSLRSTAIDITVSELGITLKTTGYGHGVGMSQYGANSFALSGKTYDEILFWYYTGVEIGYIADFI